METMRIDYAANQRIKHNKNYKLVLELHAGCQPFVYFVSLILFPVTKRINWILMQFMYFELKFIADAVATVSDTHFSMRTETIEIFKNIFMYLI